MNTFEFEKNLGPSEERHEVELSEERQREVNYIQICHNLVDSYPSGLAHGLQKDAIQNSVDARENKKKPVTVEFELFSNQVGDFLTITDSNTIGLRGKARRESIEDMDADDADWLRFENFGATKIGDDAIGARGQGKFVMLCSSTEYKMFYDTLRKDGVYRLGGTKATKVSSPLYPAEGVWEGMQAEEELAKHCGLRPLKERGTRLIVFSPKQEIIDNITSGRMAAAVQDTWFRLLEKEQLRVFLKHGGAEEEIKVEPRIETKDAGGKSWVLGVDFDDKEIIAGGVSYKIKSFEAIYSPNVVIDDDRIGISLIHQGMKIRSLTEGLPEEKMNFIQGFIEFDRRLDTELRNSKNQDPSHYDLKWRAAIPKAIRAYVKLQMQDFGREKLGLAQDPRAEKKQNQIEAEYWAMQKFMKHASDMGLFSSSGSGPGSNPKPNPDGPPDTIPSSKKLGIRIKGFSSSAPNLMPRVNWGESISFSLLGFNKLGEDIDGRLSLRILCYDREISTIIDSQPIFLPAEDMNVFLSEGDLVVEISQQDFEEKGEYRLKLQLNDEDGNKIDVQTKRFWVEENPPEKKRPFQAIAYAEMREPLIWETTGSLENDPKLYYSTRHPMFLAAAENTAELQEYMLNIFIEGAVNFILGKLDDSDDGAYDPLNTEKVRSGLKDGSPEMIYEEAMEYIAELRWRINADGEY